MSLIWDAVSCGRTKGEDESPPESRRTNGDIKSLLRPGTRATGVLCTALPPTSSFPSTCPRFLDTFLLVPLCKSVGHSFIRSSYDACSPSRETHSRFYELFFINI